MRRTVWVDPEAVESLRQLAGFARQSDLAERAGVDQATVSKMERSVHRFELRTVERVADALGVPLDRIVAPPPRTGAVADDDPELLALLARVPEMAPEWRGNVKAYLAFVLEQQRRAKSAPPPPRGKLTGSSV